MFNEIKEPQIEVKLFLKNKRKPLLMILSNESQIEKLVTTISTNNIIKFGDLIFNRDEFVYAEIKRT